MNENSSKEKNGIVKNESKQQMLDRFAKYLDDRDAKGNRVLTREERFGDENRKWDSRKGRSPRNVYPRWVSGKILSQSNLFKSFKELYSVSLKSPTRIGRIEWDLSVLVNDWSILNQYYTGSCVGFALADGILNFHLAKRKFRAGNKEENIPGFSLQSSLWQGETMEIGSPRVCPRYLWMFSKEFDGNISPPSTVIDDWRGTSSVVAMAAIWRFELALIENTRRLDIRFPTTWGAENKSLYKIAEKDFKTLALQGFQIARIYDDKINGSVNNRIFLRCKLWLFHHGPLLVEFKADNQFTIENLRRVAYLERWNGENNGYHAMTLVGWTKVGQTEYFKFKNSWGVSCGEDGFVYLSKEYLSKSLILIYSII